MTGLFDRLTLVKKPNEDIKEVDGGIPSQDVKSDAPSQAVNLGEIPDLGDGVSFGGETSPTDAILELAGDDSVFAVKGVTPFPPAFMAAQVQADYHEELFGKNNVVSVMLRAVCVWSSRYNSSKRWHFGGFSLQQIQEIVIIHLKTIRQSNIKICKYPITTTDSPQDKINHQHTLTLTELPAYLLDTRFFPLPQKFITLRRFNV